MKRKLKQLEEHIEDNAKKLDGKMTELQLKLFPERSSSRSPRTPRQDFGASSGGEETRPAREFSTRGGGEGAELRSMGAAMAALSQQMQQLQSKLDSLAALGRTPFAVAPNPPRAAAGGYMQQAAVQPRPLPPLPGVRFPQGEFDGKAAPPLQPQRPAPVAPPAPVALPPAPSQRPPPVAPPPAPSAAGAGIKKQVSFQGHVA